MCNIKYCTTVTAVSNRDKQLQILENLLRKSVLHFPMTDLPNG